MEDASTVKTEVRELFISEVNPNHLPIDPQSTASFQGFGDV